MRMIFTSLAVGLFLLSLMLGAVAWLAVIVYAIKMVRQVRAGVAPWGRKLRYNPFNVLFRTQLLTTKGIAYRRKLGWSMAIFLGMTVVWLLVGFFIGLIAGP